MTCKTLSHHRVLIRPVKSDLAAMKARQSAPEVLDGFSHLSKKVVRTKRATHATRWLDS